MTPRGELHKPDLKEEAQKSRRRDSDVAHKQVRSLFDKFEKRFKEKAQKKEDFATALAKTERALKFEHDKYDADHSFLERVSKRRNETMIKMATWTDQQQKLMTKVYNEWQ